MTKLEEILEKNRLKTDHYADQEFEAYGIISIESAMKEYAERFAKECLEIAANEADVMEEWFYNRADDEDHRWVINKDSILNIKLPDHD